VPSPLAARSPRDRRLLVIALVLLLGSVAVALVQSRGSGTPDGLTVRFAGQGCTYADGQVTARVRVTGVTSRPEQVRVTVTAYADENTSDAVGSARRTLALDGTVERTVTLTIPTDRPAYVDEDGVAACRLER
jgi:hypothetical protein